MIAYINLGTNNLKAAGNFYDELLALLGAQRVMTTERFIAWAEKPGEVMFSVIKPYDGKQATVGNGVMVALKAATTEQVEAVYHKALELGGECEGLPGPRNDIIYAAYFRDLDGNKLNACCYLSGE